MAKVVDQNIPSELLDGYRGALGQERPDGGVRKRYPFEVPTMQTEVGHPSPKQRAQRARFLIAEGDFAGIDWSTRQRWYAAAPEWGSFLWYYNYFIMSSLMGNANVDGGGVGVIKTIQFKTMAIGAGAAEGSVAITAVDITKAVVMLFGATTGFFDEGTYAAAVSIYPYVSSMASELVKCKWSVPVWAGVNVGAATISLIVIEYI